MVTREGINRLAAVFRDAYRGLRKAAAGIGFVRSAHYLAIELREAFLDSPSRNRAQVEKDFGGQKDPWNYETSPMEHERFSRQRAIRDSI